MSDEKKRKNIKNIEKNKRLYNYLLIKSVNPKFFI